MTEMATRTVASYYDVLGGGGFDRERLRALLGEQLVFEGPAGGPRAGAEPFVEGVAGFIGSVREIAFVQQVCDGDRVASLYDARLPDGTVRFAEFLELSGGAIQAIRLLFNPAEYRAAGGR